MGRLRLCVKALTLSFVILTPAWAAVPTQKPLPTGKSDKEIVYRVNLGRADDVRLLLKRESSSPDQMNSDGVPLLLLAALRKDPEGINVVKVLLEAGADVNAVNSGGQNALFYAAMEGNLETTLYLLENGIDYYKVDATGYTARAVAHNSGHANIVAALDAFVVEKTKQINREYEEKAKRLEEVHRLEDEKAQAEKTALQAEQEERNEQARALNNARKAKQREEDLKRQEEARKQREDLIEKRRQEQEAQQERYHEIETKRRSPEFEKAMQALAYASCAFQYWMYVREAKQTTELSPDELEVAIASNKELLQKHTGDIAEEYSLPEAYMEGITDIAFKRLFRQLEAMPSRTYRYEHGVGKLADLQTRCDSIARRWNEAEPKPEPKRRTLRSD